MEGGARAVAAHLRLHLCDRSRPSWPRGWENFVFSLGGPRWPHKSSVRVPNCLSNNLPLSPALHLHQSPQNPGPGLVKAYVFKWQKKRILSLTWGRLAQRRGWAQGSEQGRKWQFLCGWWCIWWKCAARAVSRQEKGWRGWVWTNSPNLKQCPYKDWPNGRKPFWNQNQVGSCHEHKLEKGREVTEKHRMIWGRAAPKLKTPSLRPGLEGKGHKVSIPSWVPRETHMGPPKSCVWDRGDCCEPLNPTFFSQQQKSHFPNQIIFSFSLSLFPSERKRKQFSSFPEGWHHIMIFKITSGFPLVL